MRRGLGPPSAPSSTSPPSARASATPRATDPEDLQKLFQERSGKMSQVARTVPEALEMAVRGVSREDLICVTGSFYVVGEALKYLAERK